MYAYFKGTLEAVLENSVILEVQDIGYNILMSVHNYDLLSKLGEEVKIYTYTCVREDAFLLYGFLDPRDMEFFKLLITVNTVGPKIAQDILSAMTVGELVVAIKEGNVKRIAKSPGVGIKKAERIVLELKDKLSGYESAISAEDLGDVTSGKETIDSLAELPEAIQNSILALVQLGYKESDAKSAVQQVLDEIGMDRTLDDYMRGALKYLL